METSANTAFVNFDGELWLAKRLGKNGAVINLFDGLTDADIRRERIRQAILKRGPATECAKERRGSLTFRQAFERLYSEPL